MSSHAFWGKLVAKKFKDIDGEVSSKSIHLQAKQAKVWAELFEEHSVSIGLWNEHNPFGPQLQIASFQATLEQYKKKLNELEPVKSAEGMGEGAPSNNDSSNGEVDNINAEEIKAMLPFTDVQHKPDTYHSKSMAPRRPRPRRHTSGIQSPAITKSTWLLKSDCDAILLLGSKTLLR
ncbi:hypothetical protein V6N13_140248 [Hibiscus sabdariffa]